MKSLGKSENFESSSLTQNEIADWFQNPEDLWMNIGDLTEIMGITHPRAIFVKTLRRHARILDMGAGNGGLQIYQRWPWPKRLDLRFFAYAMEETEHFSQYEAYEIGQWPDKKPHFNGVMFDAIVAAHFIEHIEDANVFLAWAVNQLTIGGRIYLEWPSEKSVDLPSAQDLKNVGLPLISANFYDDATHRFLPPRQQVVTQLVSLGLVIDQQGYITRPYIEPEALGHFCSGREDRYILETAYWSKTRWAQHVIATKINAE